MGYTTEFSGGFDIEPKLSDEDREFLVRFNETRRMGRKGLDPKYGIQGEWFVNGGGDFGQDRGDSIIDYNEPPCTQPSLWCQWVPNEAGTELVWDGGEKAYHMQDWIVYLLECYLKPRGYTLNGHVDAQGEEEDDTWSIDIQDNKVDVWNKECEYLKILPMVEEISSTSIENLPRHASILAQLKGVRWLDPGKKWLLHTLEERFKELEGEKDA